MYTGSNDAYNSSDIALRWLADGRSTIMPAINNNHKHVTPAQPFVYHNAPRTEDTTHTYMHTHTYTHTHMHTYTHTHSSQ